MAIFASGAGSNARKIMSHFKDSRSATVALVVSNKRDAGVLEIASEFGVPTLVIDRVGFYHSESLLAVLAEKKIDLIVLAGFLWLVPPYLVRAYPKRIINIHPALLPKFGGRGMFGMNVHEAVKAAGESISGITIHYVNEQYDEGGVIFQTSCPIETSDTPSDIARKVLELEHLHFPVVIEKLCHQLPTI
jgi:phosphoribosylglycinamide formyltransferase-1